MAETTFVYLVEGEPSVGTISDYAKAVEHGHYGGLSVDNTVWTFDENGRAQALTARFSSSPYDEDDYSYLTVELEFVKDDPETATVRIDGRA